MKMQPGIVKKFAMVVVLAGVGLLGTARADVAAARTERLSFVQGKLQVQSATGTVQMDQALENMPLLEGSTVVTGDDGQAEVEFEDGSVARLTPNSSLRLDRLAGSEASYDTQIGVLGGVAYLELRSGAQYNYTVNFGHDPAVQLTSVENATIRINLDATPEVAVLDGSVKLNGDGALQAKVGQSLQLQDGSYVTAANFTSDSWDQWNDDRDNAAANEALSRTDARNDNAGQQAYGWSDLDAYGNWYPVPGQGLMWQPSNYDASFDPYGNGYWVNYPGYGYVWVSGYPWGWTPFYCGNWNYVNGFGWGWMPAGCNNWGWGFGGSIGGYYAVNIYNSPGWYHPPIYPLHGGGGPIITVHPIHAPHPLDRNFGPGAVVVVNGRQIQPLHPVGPVNVSARASALQRDFPVNPGTHQPVMGRLPSQNPNQPLRPQSGDTRQTYIRPAQPANPGTNPGAANRQTNPVYTRPPSATAPAQPRPAAPPRQTYSPPPRSAPPASHPSSPPSSKK